MTVECQNVLTADPTISDSNGANNTVAENSAIGTTVGLTAAAAFASGDTASVSRFEITASTGGTSGANTLGKFAIDPSTGVVTVADALDYETDASHTITVKATSTDGQDNTQTFTINVSDVTRKVRVWRIRLWHLMRALRLRRRLLILPMPAVVTPMLMAMH